MSVAQKVTVLTGASGSSYVGFTPAIGALCIPAMNLEDGPAGVGDGMASVTQLPAPVDVAATWDTSAERLYGQVIGAEQAAKGSSVDLGPTINIVRDPRWGRAFESIGEDPYLNGTLGAADIQGVQSTGVMAQVKHFAVYNQETNRNTAADDAVVSTRAEQEIYLPAFQDSTQQGAASSVMCSYSTVNGTYACQNPYLLSTVLRQQFGFGGFVTSDWFATHSTAASANAGLDQDMPGTDGYFGSALQSAVSSGAVSTATLNSMVTPVLTEMFAFGLFDEPPAGSPAETATSSAHVTDALQLAEEGTVLLKNSGGVLPLTSSDKSIAVIGADASSSPLTAGGGSAGRVVQRDRHPAAGHHRRRAQRGDGQLQRRLLGQLRGRAGRLLQRRGGVRQQQRVRGQRPEQHRPVQRRQLADLRGGRREPAHGRGAEHRLRGDHAVAVLGGRGVRGLVSRPAGRDGHRRAAVRQRRPVRAPDRDLPDLAVPGAGRARRRSGPGPAGPCSTPRVSMSVTAGITPRA